MIASPHIIALLGLCNSQRSPPVSLTISTAFLCQDKPYSASDKNQKLSSIRLKHFERLHDSKNEFSTKKTCSEINFNVLVPFSDLSDTSQQKVTTSKFPNSNSSEKSIDAVTDSLAESASISQSNSSPSSSQTFLTIDRNPVITQLRLQLVTLAQSYYAVLTHEVWDWHLYQLSADANDKTIKIYESILKPIDTKKSPSTVSHETLNSIVKSLRALYLQKAFANNVHNFCKATNQDSFDKAISNASGEVVQPAYSINELFKNAPYTIKRAENKLLHATPKRPVMTDISSQKITNKYLAKQHVKNCGTRKTTLLSLSPSNKASPIADFNFQKSTNSNFNVLTTNSVLQSSINHAQAVISSSILENAKSPLNKASCSPKHYTETGSTVKQCFFEAPNSTILNETGNTATAPAITYKTLPKSCTDHDRLMFQAWTLAWPLLYKLRQKCPVNFMIKWNRERSRIGGSFIITKDQGYAFRFVPAALNPDAISNSLKEAVVQRETSFGKLKCQEPLVDDDFKCNANECLDDKALKCAAHALLDMGSKLVFNKTSPLSMDQNVLVAVSWKQHVYSFVVIVNQHANYIVPDSPNAKSASSPGRAQVRRYFKLPSTCRSPNALVSCFWDCCLYRERVIDELCTSQLKVSTSI